MDIKLELLSDPRLLQAVRGLIRCYMGGLGVDAERCGEIVLAVDEACSNAMRHAYNGRAGETLILTLSSDEAWIEVELRDQGCKAPPERVCYKEQGPPDAGNLQPGGLGVQLMYRVFDEVCFSPGDPVGNCVIMRLKRSTDPS